MHKDQEDQGADVEYGGHEIPYGVVEKKRDNAKLKFWCGLCTTRLLNRSFLLNLPLQ